MKYDHSFSYTAIFLAVFVFFSCSKEEIYEPIVVSELNLPTTPFDYVNLNLPSHFTANVPGQPLPTSINGTDNTPATNPITNDGATLGSGFYENVDRQFSEQ